MFCKKWLSNFFNPSLLRRSEFNEESCDFNYFDLNNNEKSITLNSNELAFTFCQVPIVYKISSISNSNDKILYKNNNLKEFDRNYLNEVDTKLILNRITRLIKSYTIYHKNLFFSNKKKGYKMNIKSILFMLLVFKMTLSNH